jgi:hypothetical protein
MDIDVGTYYGAATALLSIFEVQCIDWTSGADPRYGCFEEYAPRQHRSAGFHGRTVIRHRFAMG